MDLTLRYLKSRLMYEPKTGRWINRVWRGGTAHAGTLSGRPNTDGYAQICGIYRRSGKWCAYIGFNHKRIGLGKFKLKREAILARKNAEIQLYGKFARTG